MQVRIGIRDCNRHVLTKPGPDRAMLANVRAESIFADANLLELAKYVIIVANVHFALFCQLPCSQAGDIASRHEEDGGYNEKKTHLEGNELHHKDVDNG
jgi:hypothetical protein